jgi:hypothetical protein
MRCFRRRASRSIRSAQISAFESWAFPPGLNGDEGVAAPVLVNFRSQGRRLGSPYIRTQVDDRLTVASPEDGFELSWECCNSLNKKPSRAVGGL